LIEGSLDKDLGGCRERGPDDGTDAKQVEERSPNPRYRDVTERLTGDGVQSGQQKQSEEQLSPSLLRAR
jgi:hypothetical protein